MQLVQLNQCLNKEHKYYGLSSGGMIGGLCLGLLVWGVLGMLVGMISIIIGYGICAYISASLHKGTLQTLLYWYLPIRSIFAGKYLPKSYERCLL
jgi:hypothetical protein